MSERLLEQERRLQQRQQRDQDLLRQIQSKKRAQRRKDLTRLKILVGAYVLKRAEKDPTLHAWLKKELNRDLKRPHDRTLFERRFPPAPSQK